uniref:Uncharacterized protein n=1 Tax=Anopheles atroparvus TaxID=41427 RepID=A0AAG5DEZ0_ANOAO
MLMRCSVDESVRRVKTISSAHGTHPGQYCKCWTSKPPSSNRDAVVGEI